MLFRSKEGLNIDGITGSLAVRRVIRSGAVQRVKRGVRFYTIVQNLCTSVNYSPLHALLSGSE